MLDVSKLQKKGNLAKEMVRLGVVENIEDAFQQIENKEFVTSKDDFIISDQYRKEKAAQAAAAQKTTEALKPMEQSPDINARLEKLENSIKNLADFVDKYKNQNDKNMQEVDGHIKALKSTIHNLRTSQTSASSSQPTLTIEHPSEVPKVKVDDSQVVNRPKSNMNPEDYSVDKIFNNSNNRMTRK